MREIRTRPKERERKHTYTLPKQAVKTLQQQALRRKMMKRELDKDCVIRRYRKPYRDLRLPQKKRRGGAAAPLFGLENRRRRNNLTGAMPLPPEKKTASLETAPHSRNHLRKRRSDRSFSGPGRGSIFDRHRPKDVKHTRILRLPPLRSGRKHTGGPKWRTLLYSIHPARQCCLKSRYRKRDSYSPKRRRNLLHRLPSQLQRRNRKKSTKAGCF